MESDIVGHWAGVAQLEERLICNHHLCIPPKWTNKPRSRLSRAGVNRAAGPHAGWRMASQNGETNPMGQNNTKQGVFRPFLMVDRRCLRDG